jgi:hypothetical protein
MFELGEARRDELIELWAARIVERSLGTAAVFLLEAHKPLAGLGAHAILGFRPIVEALLPVNASELAAFLREPDNIERLVLRVEQLDQQRRDRRENGANSDDGGES